MRLQVASLVRNPRIADSVGLVERIRRKLLPVRPYLLDELLRRLLVLPLVDAEFRIVQTPLDELRLEFVHDVHELLAHRLAELVRLAAGEPGEKARKQHHLFLIHGDAVRVLQVLLHQRMVVGDRLPALLAVDEGRNVVHRARAVERVHCDEVRKPLRLKGDEPLLHAVGFELEQTGRLAASEKLVCLPVVVGDLVGVDVYSVELLDERNALLLDRKGLEAEKVHLEKADRLHEMSVVLRGEKRFAGGRHHRQRVDERIARDDDAAGVHAGLADRTVEAHRTLHELLDRPFVAGNDNILDRHAVYRGLKVCAFRERPGACLLVLAESLLEGDLRGVRNEAGKLVGLRERILHHTRNVLDRALRRHLSERHDVRNMILTVLLGDVFKHPAAPRVVEVDVDVGHGYPVGIEEAFEEQVVLERIYVRDAERVRHGCAGGGTASGPHPHAHVARGGDVVVHDEEVSGEAHRADRVQLELDAVDRLLRKILAPALSGSLPHERREILGLELDAYRLVVSAELLHAPFRIHPLKRGLVVLLAKALLRAEGLGDVELRHDWIGIEPVLLDHLRDFDRVLQEFRILGEYLRHLLFRLEPLLARIHETPLLRRLVVIVDLRRVAHLLSGGKAEKHVVRIVVIRVEEVDVVRGDYAHVEPLRKFYDALRDDPLAVEYAVRGAVHFGPYLRLVLHDLEREVVAEKILVPLHRILRLVHATGGYEPCNLAGKACRRAV